MNDDHRIRRTRLSDQIAGIIREDILTGRLAAGDRIVQSEWAERLGVSRMPVRDAINQLASEGVLSQGESGMALVSKTDPADIRDGYYLNAVVSSLAAGRAAQHITDAEIDELQTTEDSLVKAIADKDFEQASRLNWSFHRSINLASRSPRLIAVLKLLSTSIPHSAFQRLEDWPNRAAQDHDRILAVLRARDSDQAQRLMLEHVQAGSQPMLAELAEIFRQRQE